MSGTPGPNVYAFDPTGISSANLITGETQTITASNGADFSFIVPNFAPFFQNGLVVQYTNSLGITSTLTLNTDYVLGLQFVGASRACSSPVYGAIVFLNLTLSGTITLQYQTLGGEWTLDVSQLTAISANVVYNAPTTTWEQITGLPDVFPPTPHAWNLTDMVGMSDAVNALNAVATAITTAAAGAAPITLSASQLGLGNVLNYGMAGVPDAIAGTAANMYMSPLTTKVAIQQFASGGMNASAVNALIASYLAANPITKTTIGLGNVPNLPVVTTPQIVAGQPVSGDAAMTWNQLLVYIANHGGTVSSPAHGQLLGTYCNGYTQMGTYSDGQGGTYTGVIASNSPSCGFVQPSHGTLLGVYCVGTTQMGTYADGSGGSYTAVIQVNSTACGYSPPVYPAAGTLLSQACSGTTLMGTYANGSGGTYQQVIAANSTQCGWVAPTNPRVVVTPTPNSLGATGSSSVLYTIAGFSASTVFNYAITATAPGGTSPASWPVTGSQQTGTFTTDSNGVATFSIVVTNTASLTQGWWSFSATFTTQSGTTYPATMTAGSIQLTANTVVPTINIVAAPLSITTGNSATVTYSMSGFTPGASYTATLTGQTSGGTVGNLPGASTVTTQAFTANSSGLASFTETVTNVSGTTQGYWTLSATVVTSSGTSVSPTVNTGSLDLLLTATSPTVTVTANPTNIIVGSTGNTSTVTYAMAGFTPNTTYGITLQAMPPGGVYGYWPGVNYTMSTTFTTDSSGAYEYNQSLSDSSTVTQGTWTLSATFTQNGNPMTTAPSITPCSITLTNPNPAAGTITGHVCVGTNYMNVVADGNGGTTQVLNMANSPNCGYSPNPVLTITASPSTVAASSTTTLTFSLSGMAYNTVYTCAVEAQAPGGAMTQWPLTGTQTVLTFPATSGSGTTSTTLVVTNTSLATGVWAFSGTVTNNATSVVESRLTTSNASVTMQSGVTPTLVVSVTGTYGDILYTNGTNTINLVASGFTPGAHSFSWLSNGTVTQTSNFTADSNGNATASLVMTGSAATGNQAGTYTISATAVNSGQTITSNNTPLVYSASAIPGSTAPTVSISTGFAVGGGGGVTVAYGGTATFSASMANFTVGTYTVNFTINGGSTSSIGGTAQTVIINTTGTANPSITVTNNGALGAGTYTVSCTITPASTLTPVITTGSVTFQARPTPTIVLSGPTILYTDTNSSWTATLSGFAANTAITLTCNMTSSTQYLPGETSGGVFDTISGYTTNSSGSVSIPIPAVGNAGIVGQYTINVSASGTTSNSLGVSISSLSSSGAGSPSMVLAGPTYIPVGYNGSYEIYLTGFAANSSGLSLSLNVTGAVTGTLTTVSVPTVNSLGVAQVVIPAAYNPGEGGTYYMSAVVGGVTSNSITVVMAN